MQPGRAARPRPGGRPSGRRGCRAGPGRRPWPRRRRRSARPRPSVARRRPGSALPRRTAAARMVWPSGSSDGEALPDLEQGGVGIAAVGVALRGPQQARQRGSAACRTVPRRSGWPGRGRRRRRRTARRRHAGRRTTSRPPSGRGSPGRAWRVRVRFCISREQRPRESRPSRGSGFGSIRSRPAMRMISSTRSALPSTSGRQDGVSTFTRSPVPETWKPRRLQDQLHLDARQFEPGEPAHFGPGEVDDRARPRAARPAIVAAVGVPPQRSRTSASPGRGRAGSKAGSTPRSKR